MLTLINLAVRNLLRNRSRAAFTIGAIGFGVLMTLLLGSFIHGLGNVIIDDLIKGRVGALQVHRKGYDDVRENQPLDLDMAQDGDIRKKLLAMPGVTGVTPRLIFGGIANNGAQSSIVIVTAIDPQSEYNVMPWARKNMTGKALGLETPQGAVFGKDLAEAMQITPGKSATIQAANKTGQQNALDIDIVGTVDNGNPFESKRTLQIPLAYAQDLLGMQGRVTEFAVSIDKREAVDAIASRLRHQLGPDVEVQTWAQLRPQVADIVRYQKVALGVIGFIFLVIAVIGVVNTMLMSVLERTREIGTMMAVGLRRGKITLLFLLEGLALAVIGGAAGAALSAVIVVIVQSLGGIPATAPGATAVGYIIPIMPIELVLPTIAAATLGSLLAAVYPSWRAARLNPVDALRAI